MELLATDWSVIFIYFFISLGLGLFLSRKKNTNLTDYFLSGRRGHYLLVGTGMVATTFGADTPLAVSGLVGSSGISGNWIWWSAAIGGMFTVFFFARLWRRSGVLTDLEFIEIRYSGKLAGFLRGSKALYFGLFMNCIVMAWVNLAMLTIIEVAFPGSKEKLFSVELLGPLVLSVSVAQSMVILAALATLVYVSLSGLWGVMIADAFQFVVALGGCTLLAWYASHHPDVVAKGGVANALPSELLDFLPDFSSQDIPTLPDGWKITKIALPAFLSYIMIQWWASWYPGAEPGGGGYIAQRIMSAKDEKHGTLATLWFVVAHYCVRTWPWVIAGLCVIILYPQLQYAHGGAREGGYVRLMSEILPSPAKGLLLAAFLGAYMSTISTHLNWGASYITNDFYKRFLKPDETQSHYLNFSKLATVFILILALILGFTVLTSIADTWKFLLSTTAGMGFVLISRWYWWRVNAAAELASMLAPIGIVLILMLLKTPLANHGVTLPESPVDLFIIAPLSVLIILIVQYMTRPECPKLLEKFYDTVRPAGPGWKKFQQQGKNHSSDSLIWSLIGWLSGTLFVFSAIFFPGAIFLERYTISMICLGLMIISASGIYITIKKEFS